MSVTVKMTAAELRNFARSYTYKTWARLRPPSHRKMLVPEIVHLFHVTVRAFTVRADKPSPHRMMSIALNPIAAALIGTTQYQKVCTDMPLEPLTIDVHLMQANYMTQNFLRPKRKPRKPKRLCATLAAYLRSRTQRQARRQRRHRIRRLMKGNR